MAPTACGSAAILIDSTECRCTLVCSNSKHHPFSPEGKPAVGGSPPAGLLSYFLYVNRLQCSMPPCSCLFSTASDVHSPPQGRTRPQATPRRAGPPPPVRRASLQAARRVGAPRPEAQPARARPQAGARRCAAPEGQGEAAQACYGGAGKQRAGAPNRRNRDKVLVRYAGAERKAERRFLARAAEVVLCGATAQSGKRQAVCRNG